MRVCHCSLLLLLFGTSEDFLFCTIQTCSLLLYCVFLKALGDAADFKTDTTLKKVENFLKLCNKNAAETFFG